VIAPAELSVFLTKETAGTKKKIQGLVNVVIHREDACTLLASILAAQLLSSFSLFVFLASSLRK